MDEVDEGGIANEDDWEFHGGTGENEGIEGSQNLYCEVRDEETAIVEWSRDGNLVCSEDELTSDIGSDGERKLR
ncbi:UNVERIFIED_CONTAM: hypothetical protein Sangu_2763600 [Sesamum angustifolium]|uniref:Ig-like domain-containing protein n=1 Tax=Sesamum angustifolium TaxID=2727405 RepID=A0AAW2IWE4_9LAMI